MAQDTPVRQYLKNHKVSNVGEFIRSRRLSMNMTQVTLSKIIGCYISPRGNNQVSRYETREVLPEVEYVKKLTDALNIEGDALLTAVLREHFENFKEVHYKHYFKFMESDRAKNVENRYYFCTRGKVKYEFPKLIKMIRSSGLTDKQIVAKIPDFSEGFVRGILSGKRTPSLKILVRFAEVTGIPAFKLYKVAVEEKAIAHAKNMLNEWNKLCQG